MILLRVSSNEILVKYIRLQGWSPNYWECTFYANLSSIYQVLFCLLAHMIEKIVWFLIDTGHVTHPYVRLDHLSLCLST